MLEQEPVVDYDAAQSDDSVMEKRPSRPSTPGKHAGKHSRSEKAKFRLMSPAVLAVWIAFIIATLTLLDLSVTRSRDSLTLPWWLNMDGLPDILSTLFIQLHAPITAMYLGRLALSAVQETIGSPNSVRELFWLCEKKWSGPGVLSVVWAVAARKVRVSAAFSLFTFIMVIALITPIMFDRAFVIDSSSAQISNTYFPDTLSIANLAFVNGFDQLDTGGGAWDTQATPLELFNRTTYVPPYDGQIRPSTSNDYFFAGDAQNYFASLPGVHITGSCQAQDVTAIGDLADFKAYCTAQLPDWNGQFATSDDKGNSPTTTWFGELIISVMQLVH